MVRGQVMLHLVQLVVLQLICLSHIILAGLVLNKGYLAPHILDCWAQYRISHYLVKGHNIVIAGWDILMKTIALGCILAGWFSFSIYCWV
jgi:hypothetical protein